jgi:hypothetical protein
MSLTIGTSLHAYPQNAVVGTAKYQNGSLLYVEMSVQSASTTRVRPRTSIRSAMLAKKNEKKK